jgi:hypothetical protein
MRSDGILLFSHGMIRPRSSSIIPLTMLLFLVPLVLNNKNNNSNNNNNNNNS